MQIEPVTIAIAGLIFTILMAVIAAVSSYAGARASTNKDIESLSKKNAEQDEEKKEISNRLEQNIERIHARLDGNVRREEECRPIHTALNETLKNITGTITKLDDRITTSQVELQKSISGIHKILIENGKKNR